MPIWWYVTRASGLVAWGLLTMTMVWGLLLSTKVFGRKPSPAWLLDLHRFAGAATTLFTLVHVAGILADSYVNFDLTDTLVPFASSWNPLAVALGIVGLYLLVAVELTSLLRRHLPNRIWRRVHYASFPLFITATMHGISAGTDAGTTIAVLVGMTAMGVVGLLVALRIDGRARVARSTRPTAAATPPPARPMVSSAAGTRLHPPARRPANDRYEARSNAATRGSSVGAASRIRDDRTASAVSAASK
jgi:predicted ferric reductase